MNNNTVVDHVLDHDVLRPFIITFTETSITYFDRTSPFVSVFLVVFFYRGVYHIFRTEKEV